MSFVAILVALLLEQARPLAPGNRLRGMVRGWVSWTARNFDAGRPQHGILAWGVAVIAPALLVTMAYWLLVQTLGWTAAVVWNIFVLYMTLGFRQFSLHFTELRDTLEAGDEERARRLLAAWKQVDATHVPRSAIVRQLVEFSVIAAHRQVFGVLTWFSLLAALGLGPAGAVLYRMSEFVPRYWADKDAALLQPVSAPLRDLATRAWWLMDWLPARVSAFGFAVVGSFEEAIESWRNYVQLGSASNDGIILAATAGAINLRLGRSAVDTTPKGHVAALDGSSLAREATTGSGQEPEVGHLRTVVGLIWRTVVMWMTLLALLTLARLLG